MSSRHQLVKSFLPCKLALSSSTHFLHVSISNVTSLHNSVPALTRQNFRGRLMCLAMHHVTLKMEVECTQNAHTSRAGGLNINSAQDIDTSKIAGSEGSQERAREGGRQSGGDPGGGLVPEPRGPRRRQ